MAGIVASNFLGFGGGDGGRESFMFFFLIEFVDEAVDE